MASLNKNASYFAFVFFSRIFLGGMFVLSGFEKLTHPPEEFVVVLKNYQLLPDPFLKPFALFFPWIEILFGTFLIIGLFYKVSLVMVGLLLFLLTSAIGITLLRGIPLEDCGCFKSLGVKESGGTAIFRNAVLLIFWLNLYFYPDQRWTVDQWFKDKPD